MFLELKEIGKIMASMLICGVALYLMFNLRSIYRRKENKRLARSVITIVINLLFIIGIFLVVGLMCSDNAVDVNPLALGGTFKEIVATIIMLISTAVMCIVIIQVWIVLEAQLVKFIYKYILKDKEYKNYYNIDYLSDVSSFPSALMFAMLFLVAL